MASEMLSEIIEWVEKETDHAQRILLSVDPKDMRWASYWRGRLQALEFLRDETYG